MKHVSCNDSYGTRQGSAFGQLRPIFAEAACAEPHTKTGRRRPRAATAAEPSGAFRGLPTIVASGLPGYESVNRIISIATGNLKW